MNKATGVDINSGQAFSECQMKMLAVEISISWSYMYHIYLWELQADQISLITVNICHS